MIPNSKLSQVAVNSRRRVFPDRVAPIMIAFFTSAILLLVFGHLSGWFVLVALAAYLTVGVILPIITTKLAREDGRRYRELVGEMNDFFLDSVRGMKEIQLFGYVKQRLDEIQQRSQKIDTAFERIKDQEAKVRVYTEVAVSVFNIIMLFTGLILFSLDKIDFSAFLIGVILLMSSYGPVIALSNLSSNLLQTLASGERVLSLLAEEPELKDVESAVDLKEVSRIDVENVNFAYGEEQILSDVSLSVKKGEILGIHGRSGSGKSTLLRAVAGIWPYVHGKLELPAAEKLMFIPQKPYLPLGTLKEALLYPGSCHKTDEELVMLLEQCRIGYLAKDLYVEADWSHVLSGGEQQRLALAKVLLLRPRILLMDEPTKGMDAEYKEEIGKILCKLKQHGLTIFMISHDVEFVAEYADRVGLFFEGNIVTSQNTREFFAGNNFYTTAANRMARHLFPEAVTGKDVIACLRHSN